MSPFPSSDLLLALPVTLPLLAAILAVAAWRHVTVQRGLVLTGAAGLLAASLALLAAVWQRGVLSTEVGDWPAPFGIVLVADLFSALMLVVSSLVGLAVVLYSFAALDRRREEHGFHPLVLTLLTGVCGAFLAGDLFNLYVWFEVLLISSFVLLALGGEARQMQGAIRYFVLNLLSSALFLSALGILYGKVASLNLADLALRVGEVEPALLSAVAVLLMLAFGLKAAIFPLFFWLPDSYPTPPPVVSALFAGLLTKVGVYALVRAFTLLFVHDLGYTHTLLLWLAALTMVTGVLGAVSRGAVREILSFHIVSQIGYMVLGLALLTPLALAGAVFYIVHHIVVKTNLFLVGGAMERIGGTGRLADLGSLVRRAPLLAVVFAVAALSLAGVPPLSGFWAKLFLVWAALDTGAWIAAGVALAVGLLTLLSMSKIWNEAFWKPARLAPEPGERVPSQGPVGLPVLLTAPSVGLAAVTVAIGLGAGWLFPVTERAAEQLLDRSVYVGAVLGPEAVAELEGQGMPGLGPAAPVPAVPAAAASGPAPGTAGTDRALPVQVVPVQVAPGPAGAGLAAPADVVPLRSLSGSVPATTVSPGPGSPASAANPKGGAS